MARRANGLDLSEAIIIVDYLAIKNTLSTRPPQHACVNCGFNVKQDYEPAC